MWAASLLRAPGGPGSSLCERIDSSIPDTISYSTSVRYNDSLSSYYSGQESELQPECVFTPRDTSEVSLFIKLITADAAGDGQSYGIQPQLAIRSGGHAVFAGAANIEGGITIDLRALDSFVLSEDRKTASIGTGEVWSEIYPKLVPYNLTVMGGRVAGVGVGGFLTGGELRYYPSSHLSIFLAGADHQLISSRWHISPVKEIRLGL